MNYNYKNFIWVVAVIIILLFINRWLQVNTRVKEGFASGLNPEFNSIDTLEATFKPVPGFVPWPKDLVHRFKIYQKNCQ